MNLIVDPIAYFIYVLYTLRWILEAVISWHVSVHVQCFIDPLCLLYFLCVLSFKKINPYQNWPHAKLTITKLEAVLKKTFFCTLKIKKSITWKIYISCWKKNTCHFFSFLERGKNFQVNQNFDCKSDMEWPICLI